MELYKDQQKLHRKYAYQVHVAIAYWCKDLHAVIGPCDPHNLEHENFSQISL